jgi:hypothetical protein
VEKSKNIFDFFKQAASKVDNWPDDQWGAKNPHSIGYQLNAG